MHALIADAQHLNGKEKLHGNFHYLQQHMLHLKTNLLLIRAPPPHFKYNQKEVKLAFLLLIFDFFFYNIYVRVYEKVVD